MSETKSFEQLYHELETAVQQLEAGDLDLDASLALFGRANRLAEQCSALLDRAELRVRQLAVDPAGGLSTEPLAAAEA